MTDNIINTFQQRRQLERALADFANTHNEVELTEVARHIAHTFPVDLVLPFLLKHLDTDNSQVRGGLGHLAALLPSETVAPALRNAAANRQNSPQARLTALTIAQRFLGLDLPTALTDDLNNSDDVALQSLREAVEEGRRNRHVLLEYVTQMQQHPEEIAFLVMGALERLDPGDRVELLRLLAQDQRPAVAQEALRRLEQLVNSEASGAALRALYILQFALPAALAPQIERTVRKLQFSGKRYIPPSPTGWRALLGPAEPNGSQAIWLLRCPDEPTEPGVLLSFVVNLGAGVLQFFASEQMERTLLPDPKPVGQLVAVMTDRGVSTVLLEAPFDYGRWLVAQILHLHRTQAAAQALPAEYTLYSDLIWQFASPQVADEVKRYLQKPSAGEQPVLDLERLDYCARRLFEHPVMEHWAVQGRALLLVMQRSVRPQPSLPVEEIVNALLRDMGKWPEGNALLLALERGLRAQAGWLHHAGNPELAGYAQLLADQIEAMPVAQNPVLGRMLALGLYLSGKMDAG